MQRSTQISCASLEVATQLRLLNRWRLGVEWCALSRPLNRTAVPRYKNNATDKVGNALIKGRVFRISVGVSPTPQGCIGAWSEVRYSPFALFDGIPYSILFLSFLSLSLLQCEISELSFFHSLFELSFFIYYFYLFRSENILVHLIRTLTRRKTWHVL